MVLSSEKEFAADGHGNVDAMSLVMLLRDSPLVAALAAASFPTALLFWLDGRFKLYALSLFGGGMGLRRITQVGGMA